MKALILVNLQNDYLPGGAVAVPQGDSLIAMANQLQGSFKLVVATQEWHPSGHRAFVQHYPGRRIGEVVKLRKHSFTLQAPHALQNTKGAELASALMMNRVNKVFRLGLELEMDDYSAFFDDGHMAPTGLHEFLKEKKVTDIFVMGLPLERTVRQTVLDGVDLGFATFLVEDACRAWDPDPETAAKIVTELKAAGAKTISSGEMLRSIY